MDLRGELLVTPPRRLCAPQEHGTVLAEPPLTDVEALVAGNRQRLAGITFQLLGRSAADLRREASYAAVQAARDYLQQAGEPVADYGATSLFMAGHQPELFHPGVWVKNFALNGLARTLGATPINLIVDNDTAKATSLRIPVLKSDEHPWPHTVTLPYDQWSGEVPYEERTVRDEDLFTTLPARATLLLQGWGFVPLLGAYWAEACRQGERTPLLGERLVAARRVFERQWGCPNLELPVGRLCRTEPFAWFACHLLAELPRFHAIYNECIRAYRRQYGIRSRNHPVPELTRDGDWLEAPFWAWHAGQQERGRLLVRRTEHTLALRVGTEPWPELSANPNADPVGLVQEWQALEQRGFKVRSRALTNTLFARIFLADLFIHGIGGGKYDELTDEIVRRFYGYEPPRYLVLSATLLLPLPILPARPAECRRLSWERRDLYYNPQRHLGAGKTAGTTLDLAAQKQAWIAHKPTNAEARRTRFQTLRALTEQLRASVSGRLRTLEQEIARCSQQLQGNAILQRRDYAFCLYPETMLRSFCTHFLRSSREPSAEGLPLSI
jgi:hypothetical protein